jgi:hypothetical protein
MLRFLAPTGAKGISIKLETLLVLMAVAAALAAKTGASASAARARPIPVKNHGRRAISYFAFGLTVLRKILASKINDQVIAFLHALVSGKIPPKPLIRLGF